VRAKETRNKKEMRKFICWCQKINEAHKIKL
jgi:hypothetical protein